jgi:retinol dehydrogenase 8
VPPNRSILITGCSSPSGIGFASARALAGAGHAVHATVRDHTHDQALVEGLEGRLEIHDLDLLDRASLTRAVGDVVAAEGRLDVLINNAGYGLIGGVEQVELDLARANLETNFLGTAALIQEVLPVMRRQEGGHIVNVSTIFSAGLCPPALGYYIASKAALETLSQALAVEAEPWNVRVTNFQPGPVATDLSRQWGQRVTGDQDPRPTLTDELYQWVAEHGPGLQSPTEVAAALQQLVESDAPPLAGQSGPESESYVAAALRDPTRMSELRGLLEAFASRVRT